MTTKMTAVTLAIGLASAAIAAAGDGFSMKCQAAPKNGAKACGYEAEVRFGGGMFFEQVTGYCRKCKKFVYLTWTSKNIPAELKGQVKQQARPEPLGEAWNASTGKVTIIHACPTCKGPFTEIKNADELKHCPSCNEPHFGIDESKPRMAID